MVTNGRAKHSLLLATAILVGASPSIITSENWQSNRSLVMPQWLLCFFMFYGLFRILKNISIRFVTHFLMILCLIGSTLNGIFLATLWKQPQLAEINLAKASLSSEDCRSAKAIRPSGWQDSIAKYVSMDEFGLPSSTPTWSVAGLTRFICREKNVEIGNLVILSRKTPAEKNIDPEVIDYGSILLGHKLGS